MRRWLLLLLIALLPLRGWVGEAMAGEMAQRQVQAAAAVQATERTQHAHDDCAGHDDDAAASHHHGDCPTCAGCQACSAAALVSFVATPAIQRLPQALPTAPEPSSRDAGPQTVLKPPIS